MTRFDWTTGFSLSPKAYDIIQHEEKVEIVIPVFGASKNDIEIKTNIRGRYNTIGFKIPDTPLSYEREFAFEVSESYDVKKAKANVRDGILYVYIPLRKESKSNRIEIT